MNTPQSPLHPRLAELVEDLQQSRRELHACLALLTDAQRQSTPTGDSWSVAQIVEHLALVESGVGRLLSKMIKDAEATGERETDTASLLTSLDRFRLDTPTVRFPAPEGVQPSEGLSLDAALDRLAGVREKLLSVMPRASGLPLGKVTFPHPAIGPLTGYGWILMLAQHERRHTRQIEQVAASAST